MKTNYFYEAKHKNKLMIFVMSSFILWRYHEGKLYMASFFIIILLRCYVLKLFNTELENGEILSLIICMLAPPEMCFCVTAIYHSYCLYTSYCCNI